MRFWPAMHELAICQALICQVAELADQKSATAVNRILVSVGPLSGVESMLLQNAFPIAAAGTVADGAELRIEILPVRVHCTACEVESIVAPNRLLCDKCGDWRTKLVSGDELLLTRVELDLGDYPRRLLKAGAATLGLEG